MVTGASAGIGRATAMFFARHGTRVALLARGAEGLAGASRGVEAAGGRALAIPTDVADAAQVDAAAQRIEAELEICASRASAAPRSTRCMAVPRANSARSASPRMRSARAVPWHEHRKPGKFHPCLERTPMRKLHFVSLAALLSVASVSVAQMDMKMMDTNNDNMISKQEFMKHQEAMFDKMKKNNQGMVATKDMEMTMQDGMRTNTMRGDTMMKDGKAMKTDKKSLLSG